MSEQQIATKLLPHILCVDASHFNDRKDGFSNYKLKPEDIIIARRNELESNLNYRQLLPNVIFTNEGKVWAYERTEKGGEPTLHKQVSVCVGGHWDITDLAYRDDILDDSGKPIPGIIDLEASFEIALDRELEEEVNINANIVKTYDLDTVVAADITPTDQKHVAFVRIVELESVGGDAPLVESSEDELLSYGFIEPKELIRRHEDGEIKLETWAIIACRMLIKSQEK